MEQFSILEKKLMALIEIKKQDTQRITDLTLELERSRDERRSLEERSTVLQQELVNAHEEITLLRAQTEKLEEGLLARHQNIEGLHQERELTKMAVDDLIKSIDVLIEAEHTS
jgi:chromosome segregation ATPase